MMVEKTAKTIDEAIQAALKELNITQDRAEIEVIEEPSKGILGFMAKPAKVRVIAKLTKEDIAKEFLDKIFKNMQIDVAIKMSQEEQYLKIDLIGNDLGILIGRRGETLDALQYLVNLVVNKKYNERTKIVLDIENYRKRREDTLIGLAVKLSEKVKRTGYNVTLEPMNPHERRIIHTALQNDKKVFTYSEGEEPYRKVVISLKK